MRISCVAFARITNDHGQLALTASSRGDKILSPIGGGLKITRAGMKHLIQAFGAKNFEQDTDLRFHVPDQNVEDVMKWFASRDEHRELTVMRTLRESLVDGPQTHEIKERLWATARYDAKTIRNVRERQTAYLIEVYDLEVPRAIRIVLSLAVRSSKVYFVTPQEIMSGDTKGTGIVKITRSLILPEGAAP